MSAVPRHAPWCRWISPPSLSFLPPSLSLCLSPRPPLLLLLLALLLLRLRCCCCCGCCCCCCCCFCCCCGCCCCGSCWLLLLCCCGCCAAAAGCCRCCCCSCFGVRGGVNPRTPGWAVLHGGCSFSTQCLVGAPGNAAWVVVHCLEPPLGARATQEPWLEGFRGCSMEDAHCLDLVAGQGITQEPLLANV